MLRFLKVMILCLVPLSVNAGTQDFCLKQLPSKLYLEKGVPQNMQFVSDYTQLVNYEILKDGEGWGHSLKYQNAYCEVVVYVYNRQKTNVTGSDVEDELAYFDGFQPNGKFDKTVGSDTFKGYAGMAVIDEKTGPQMQMVAITHTANQFVKYRTSCRKMNGLSDESNFRMTDQFTTQVIKGTYGRLLDCLKNK